MNMSHCSKYFNKFFIFFGSFVFLLPLEATTYNLICEEDRFFLIKYRDKISSNDLLTLGRSQFREIKNSKKKFKVSYDLKSGFGYVGGSLVKAVRHPKVNEYAPLFLFSSDFSYETFISEDNIKESEFDKINQLKLLIDSPLSSSTQYFLIKSKEEIRTDFFVGDSSMIPQDTLDSKNTFEISNGFCSPIK